MLEPIAIVDDATFDAHHERGGGHPERPERLTAARAGLYATLDADHRVSLDAPPARPEQLCWIHDSAHVERIERALEQGYGHLDPDTFFSPGSREAALRAAGGAAALVTELCADEGSRRGVALLRPPGHHAEPNRAMGFCLYNNVAIAAMAALQAGCQRVAIVDWDVHHGNGTQAAFERDPRVLFVSLHQYPCYPGTGAPEEVGLGAAAGTTANLAIPPGQGSETYAYAFRRVVLPALDRFEPELILVSAGFDAHARDPLAQMQLDTESYAAMASALLRSADRLCQGRIAFILEGGYDLQALSDCWSSVGRSLLGEHTELDESPPDESGQAAVDATAAALQAHAPL
ncbi:MAG: histone deacetylase [Myxococcales bacterium]|nr:histone deacetylase [Myxococcales bacterium]